MELINKEELINKINAYMITTADVQVVKNLINNMPTVDRPKGKWIHDGLDFPHGVDWTHCSVCGRKGKNVPADLTNFCPDCGADMRGEKNENNTQQKKAH